MMESQLSILEYIKRKYKLDYLEEIISVFYLSLFAAIIIYLSMKFEVIQMTCVIFIILWIAIFIINQIHKKKYEEKIEVLNSKMKDITELIQEILPTK